MRPGANPERGIIMSFGSIHFSDKKGYYQGNVQFNGIYKSFYGYTKKEVQSKIDQFVFDIKYNNLNTNNIVLFSAYCYDYIDHYKKGVVKDSTYDRYESTINCYIKDSKIDIPLYKLDDGLLQGYLVSLASFLSNSSIKKIYDMFRMVLFYAYKKKDIDYDIASFLVVPRSVKKTKKIQVYTSDEINVLVDTIEKGIISNSFRDIRRYRVAPGYLVLYYSGLRAGELLALQKNDLDFDRKIIHVNKTLSHIKARDSNNKVYKDVISIPKTSNSVRDVPMSDNCRKYLLWLLSDDIDSDYIIHNQLGGCMKLRSFQQTFMRICLEDAHIPYNGLHALRHSFTSNLINKGADVAVVSRILGHSSVKFTYDRYFHTNTVNDYNTVSLLD